MTERISTRLSSKTVIRKNIDCKDGLVYALVQAKNYHHSKPTVDVEKGVDVFRDLHVETFLITDWLSLDGGAVARSESGREFMRMIATGHSGEFDANIHPLYTEHIKECLPLDSIASALDSAFATKDPADLMIINTVYSILTTYFSIQGISKAYVDFVIKFVYDVGKKSLLAAYTDHLSRLSIDPTHDYDAVVFEKWLAINIIFYNFSDMKTYWYRTPESERTVLIGKKDNEYFLIGEDNLDSPIKWSFKETDDIIKTARTLTQG